MVILWWPLKLKYRLPTIFICANIDFCCCWNIYLLELVLARIELIFSEQLAQFGFLLETVLTTQRCFSYSWAELTQIQGLFCSCPHPTSEDAEGAQGARKEHSQESWAPLTTGISQSVWHNAQHMELQEEGGREEWREGRYIHSHGVFLHKSH